MEIVELTYRYFEFLKMILSKRWNMSVGDLQYFIDRWSTNECNSICYIGIINGEPIGYGVFDTEHEIFNDLSPVCTSLWVHPDHRGNSYGYEFTKLRFDHARKLGYNEIYLDTLSAMNYHLKFGWEIIDKRLWPEYGEVTIMKHKL